MRAAKSAGTREAFTRYRMDPFTETCFTQAFRLSTRGDPKKTLRSSSSVGANERHKTLPNAVRCRDEKKTEDRKGRLRPAGEEVTHGPLGAHPLPTEQRAGRQLRNSLWISARALRWHVGVITAPPDRRLPGTLKHTRGETSKKLKSPQPATLLVATS